MDLSTELFHFPNASCRVGTVEAGRLIILREKLIMAQRGCIISDVTGSNKANLSHAAQQLCTCAFGPVF